MSRTLLLRYINIQKRYTCGTLPPLWAIAAECSDIPTLKVHKNENFFGFDLEFCIISLLVMHK